jgi:uncharacterized protein YfcZ (UPF0381/DUF406 family)
MEIKTPTTVRERVIAALNIGDEGKVLSFFSHLEKVTRKDITNIKANMSAALLEHTQILDNIKDDLVDAEQGVKEAYEAVDIDSIQTNADQKSYISEYLSQVNDAKAVITQLTEREERVVKAYNSYVEAENKRLTALEQRLVDFGV